MKEKSSTPSLPISAHLSPSLPISPQARMKEKSSTKESARLAGAIAELEMRNDAGQRQVGRPRLTPRAPHTHAAPGPEPGAPGPYKPSHRPPTTLTRRPQVKGLVKDKEEAMVGADVLKLEVKRLREQLSAKADEVFGLQNRKFQLQMSMEERQQEIKVHTEVLRSQLKAATEERGTAAKELSDRLIRVDRLNNKYDIICGRMGADGEGDGDGEHTQAYYVIKAAQEREELQRQVHEHPSPPRPAASTRRRVPPPTPTLRRMRAVQPRACALPVSAHASYLPALPAQIPTQH